MLATGANAHNAKIGVCHIPPGKPTNQHVINVSINALNAHVGHGDHLFMDAEACNGIDDDCDGNLGFGEPHVVTATEGICDDGLDNDCDGLVDGADSDCVVADAQCSEPYITISDATRNVTFSGTGSCDINLAIGWYRFVDPAGTQLPETAPPTSHCRTHATGWMNGVHPDVEDGVVSRTACYHWAGNQCQWSNPIKAVNCGDFHLYELRPPPACNLGYCATN